MTALILHSRNTILLEGHLRRQPCELRFYVSLWDGVGNVHYRTAEGFVTRMFWEGEKPGAPEPIDNIRKMPA
jgi:hypothetical protein